MGALSWEPITIFLIQGPALYRIPMFEYGGGGQHAGLKHFTSVVNAYIRANARFLFCYASSMQS